MRLLVTLVLVVSRWECEGHFLVGGTGTVLTPYHYWIQHPLQPARPRQVPDVLHSPEAQPHSRETLEEQDPDQFLHNVPDISDEQAHLNPDDSQEHQQPEIPPCVPPVAKKPHIPPPVPHHPFIPQQPKIPFYIPLIPHRPHQPQIPNYIPHNIPLYPHHPQIPTYIPHIPQHPHEPEIPQQPEIPHIPHHPHEPEIPQQPEIPHIPHHPHEPEIPQQPEIPHIPHHPHEPEIPQQPEIPHIPHHPHEPEIPQQPEIPHIPHHPHEPEIPQQPEIPHIPHHPHEPEIPQQPEIPHIPHHPHEPEIPQQPEIPHIPHHPHEPEIPQQPEIPHIPHHPHEPEIPQQPEIPHIPHHPHEPEIPQQPEIPHIPHHPHLPPTSRPPTKHPSGDESNVVYNGPNKDGSYDFSYSQGDQRRSEKSDGQGNVQGTYSYHGPDGKEITVTYTAGANKGFIPVGEGLLPPPLPHPHGHDEAQVPHVPQEEEYPDNQHDEHDTQQHLLPDEPAVPETKRPVEPHKGGHVGMPYSYKYDAELSSKSETADDSGNVKGSYSYIDGAGVHRKVEYTVKGDEGFVAKGDIQPDTSMSGTLRKGRTQRPSESHSGKGAPGASTKATGWDKYPLGG